MSNTVGVLLETGTAYPSLLIICLGVLIIFLVFCAVLFVWGLGVSVLCLKCAQYVACVPGLSIDVQ